MPPDNKPDLSVTELKAYALREPVSRRAYTILEARTKGGLTGYGECSAATPEALAQARQSTTGQPATSYEVISRLLSAYPAMQDRKSTRLNSSHGYISYAVFCLKK